MIAEAFLIICIIVLGYFYYKEYKELDKIETDDKSFLELKYNNKLKTLSQLNNVPELDIIKKVINQVLVKLMAMPYDDAFSYMYKNSINEQLQFCKKDELEQNFNSAIQEFKQELSKNPTPGIKEDQALLLIDYYKKLLIKLRDNLCLSSGIVDAEKLYSLIGNLREVLTDEDYQNMHSIGFQYLHNSLVKIINDPNTYKNTTGKDFNKLIEESMQKNNIYNSVNPM